MGAGALHESVGGRAEGGRGGLRDGGDERGVGGWACALAL